MGAHGRRTGNDNPKGEGDRHQLSVNEYVGVVEKLMTVSIMIAVMKDEPERKGEAVLMRGDNESATRSIRKCHGVKGMVRGGGLRGMLGMLEDH